jgi:hypothetical protein
MNTKRIWARLEIANSSDLFDFPDRTSLVPYVNACFERSHDLALDVELELESFLSCRRYISESICRSVKDILDHEDQTQVRDMVYGGRWKTSSSGYNLQRSRAFNSIFGVNSDRIVRYSTLELSLPENKDILRDICQRMAHVLPCLKSFKLIHSTHSPRGAFSSLPSLETLVLKADIPFTIFNVKPRSLRHLEIFLMQDPSTLVGLSSFKLLRTLKIRLFVGISTIKEPPIFLHLPHLDQLFIRGYYSALEHVVFQLPSLNLLALHSDYSTVDYVA